MIIGHNVLLHIESDIIFYCEAHWIILNTNTNKMTRGPIIS